MVGSGRAVVTGAGGFVGSAVVRALRDAGHAVRAAVRPGGDRRNLAGLDVEVVEADVRDPAAIGAAVRGAELVFHLAAVYRFWAPDPRVFAEVNVRGTQNVLVAARAAGCARVVYTGTVGTLGIGTGPEAAPASEDSVADVSHLFGHYKRTKYVAEHEVLRAAAGGLPVVLVQPTTPVGPRDFVPTPTGRIVRDFLDGRLPAYVDTWLNVVDVDDVARGHLLAAERGQPGRSYVLGGENRTLRELLLLLAEVTGLSPPRVRVPLPLLVPAAHVSELVQGRLLRREPFVPLEATRMARTRMAFDDSRAREELGHSSRPARQALARAAEWYLANGFVRPRRRARVRLGR